MPRADGSHEIKSRHFRENIILQAPVGSAAIPPSLGQSLTEKEEAMSKYDLTLTGLMDALADKLEALAKTL